jgi:hypothetical protein
VEIDNLCIASGVWTAGGVWTASGVDRRQTDVPAGGRPFEASYVSVVVRTGRQRPSADGRGSETMGDAMRPLVGALVAMCALVVLACGGSDGGADDHGAARERTSTAPTSAVVIASTTTTRPAATGGPDDGCPSNGGREPGEVVKASVVDVDGDGATTRSGTRPARSGWGSRPRPVGSWPGT